MTDRKINQKLGLAMLNRMKMKAELAENGKEALSMITRYYERYSLVLMDCQMPVMNGFEAMKRIRSFERDQGKDRRVPIIALTANVSQQSEKDCLDSGADHFLSKPLTMKSLRDEIGYFLTLNNNTRNRQDT